MNEITRETRLTAIVLTHPAGRDRTTCALMRLLEETAEDKFLDKRAERLGFSLTESKGIMDGLDVASGRVSLGVFEGGLDNHGLPGMPEYQSGRALGERLWRMVESQ